MDILWLIASWWIKTRVSPFNPNIIPVHRIRSVCCKYDRVHQGVYGKETFLSQMQQSQLSSEKALKYFARPETVTSVRVSLRIDDPRRILKNSIFFMLFHFDELWVPTFVFHWYFHWFSIEIDRISYWISKGIKEKSMGWNPKFIEMKNCEKNRIFQKFFKICFPAHRYDSWWILKCLR